MVEEGYDHSKRWWTLVVLCLSTLVLVIENMALNVAIPPLTRDLRASAQDIQWILDAYILVFAGLLLTAGSLGDRYGRRAALNGGLIVFGVASLFAVLSSSATAVIAARAVMGIGAAFVMPATLSVLAHVFPPAERPRAIAIWAGFAGVGAALGGVTSGWLLQHFWWGSIFLTNVAVVAIALIAGAILVPSAADDHELRCDPPCLRQEPQPVPLLEVAVEVTREDAVERPVREWKRERVSLDERCGRYLLARDVEHCATPVDADDLAA